MGKRWTARRANGVVSAVVAAFFFAHGALGALSAFTGFVSPLHVLVWAGVALIGVHVAVSVVTSRQQLTDRAYPPSARKKRHLMLKWATGLLLGGVAIAHVVCPKGSLAAALAIAALSVALAVHVCVGAKSLLKDLGVDRRYRGVVRAAACALAAAFVLAQLAGLAMR